jgi:hypothetical protein
VLLSIGTMGVGLMLTSVSILGAGVGTTVVLVDTGGAFTSA